jgi:urease accessory protein UreF
MTSLSSYLHKNYVVCSGIQISRRKGKILLLYDKFLCIYMSAVTARELGQNKGVRLMLKLKKFIFSTAIMHLKVSF